MFSKSFFKPLLTCLGVVILSTVFLQPIHISAQTQSAGISIAPAEASDPQNAQTKAWFIETIEPGNSVERTAKLTNNSPTDQIITISAKDASQTSDGSFSYIENDEANKQAGSWVSLSSQPVTLKPGESVQIPFKITVPSQATSGEYAAVLAAQITNPSNVEGIAIQNRIGARIYITVPGTLSMNASISDLELINPESKYYQQVFTLPSTFDRMYAGFTFKNLGNVYTKAVVTLNLTSSEGNISKTVELDTAPNQEQFVRIIDLENNWELAKYQLSATAILRPIITSNKPDLVSQNLDEVRTEFSMNQDTLDTLKKDRETNQTAQLAQAAASGTLSINYADTKDSGDSNSKNMWLNTTTILIGGGIILLLVAILVLVVFILIKSKKGDQSSNTEHPKNNPSLPGTQTPQLPQLPNSLTPENKVSLSSNSDEQSSQLAPQNTHYQTNPFETGIVDHPSVNSAMHHESQQDSNQTHTTVINSQPNPSQPTNSSSDTTKPMVW